MNAPERDPEPVGVLPTVRDVLGGLLIALVLAFLAGALGL